MNKPKFKTVMWKHGNTQMHSLMENDYKYYWQSDLFPFAAKHGFIKVPEDFIEQYPELFEVEKAEREFEDGAWYKAKIKHYYDWEAVRFYEGYGFLRVGLMAYEPRTFFYEIGEKIEL